MVKKVNKYFMGRLKSPFDVRDYNLKNFIPRAAEPTAVKEKVWEYPYSEPLNQEDTPHCVGFSMANFGINYPVHTPYTANDGHDFYYRCKVLDGEPKKENGSYVRTAAQILKGDGRIDAYAFAPDIATVKWWLLNRGCMIVGTVWTVDMFYPDEFGIIKPTGDIVGGHAYLLNEWRIDDYIGIQNSWGNTWGLNGKGYISAVDFGKIFNYDGEAMAAVELENLVPKPVEKECWLITLLKSLHK